jgi:hypothetical protein
MARHPGVESAMRWLEPNPNLPAAQREIAEAVHGCAVTVLNAVPDEGGPELTAGLRKLLEAKDCLVRASLEAERLHGG